MTARGALVLAAGALLLPACGAQPAAGDAPVRVYKSFGTVQCGDSGATLPELERQLAAAAVKPLASSCGSDGRMRPAVCGAADGRIAIFDIPAGAASAAAAAGFAPLARLPDARAVPCR